MFLCGAVESLLGGRRLSAEQRLQLVREQIFGVDIDSDAVDQARDRLRELIAPDTAPLQDNCQAVLARNLQVGDALTGLDFAAADGREANSRGIDWRDTFPQVAEERGFDVVLGNPPYRKERDAKDLFDTIAASPLGRRWREPRMDLWYYFMHRGLDLLKPGGLLSFIVGSYWTASTGAQKMIARLRQEATLSEVVLLHDQKVFADVQGRHLIFLAQKGNRPDSCRVVSLPRGGQDNEAAGGGLVALEQLAVGHGFPTTADIYEIPPADLYHGGQLNLARPSGPSASLSECRELGRLFETAQGIAENPPRITKRHCQEFSANWRVGAGVFVLNKREIEELGLNRAEQELLQPYFELADLGRYSISERPSNWILYLTRDTATEIEQFPNVMRHLAQYQAVMDRRRETRLGRNAWWHLHWPRRMRLFTEPAVLCVQMGRAPAFVLAERPAFVGFSTNVVLQKPASPFSLAALTAILNSTFAADWFSQFAKRRGVNLEINLHVLRQFPVPPHDASLDRQLAELVAQRQAERDCESEQSRELERRIDEIVAELYQRASREPRGD